MTLTLKDGTTCPGEARELEALAKTLWPRSVTEFGPAVLPDGTVTQRTLLWETPEARAADVNGENVCAILA